MSKKNKTAVIPAPDSLDAQIAALQARKAELAEQTAAAAKLATAALDAKIAGIPSTLGVENMDAAIALIRAYNRRGTTGKVTTNKRGTRITDAQKTEIVNLLKTQMSGSEVAAKVGVSLPSVYALKKAAGLTKTRKVKKAA